LFCQDLWHIYQGGGIALREANLTINRGEIKIGIIGQMDLAKLLVTQLQKPTRGVVL